MSTSAVFPGWRVVGGSGFGIAFGSAVFASAAFPQLAAAWGPANGWTQPELAKAATIFLLLQTITYPIYGWLLDRFGSRNVACASITLFALALFALSRIGNSLKQLYAAFALIGLVSAGTNVISYARAISLWFKRKRGLALGLAAASQAVGAVLVPLLMARTIASAGASSAVLTMVGIELIVCLPLVWALVRNSPVPYGLQPDGDAVSGAATSQAVLTGPSRGEILRSGTFWRLALCFALMGLTTYAILINFVFILGKITGMPPAEAAKIQAIAGASVLVGRIGFGWLLDRMRGTYVSVIALVVSALGIAVLALMPGGALVGALLIGCSVGGESDLMPYLAGRYFGTRSVSSVFGWFLAIFFIGAAIGPVVFASSAAAQGSVVTPLLCLLGLQLMPAAIFLSIGGYPQFTPREPARAPS